MQIDSLTRWNPWWESGKVPDSIKGINRKIDPLLFSTLKEKEIIALTGVRRGGKTTIMYQMISYLLQTHEPPQIFYLNLDDETLKKESLESIYLFYRQNKNPDKLAFVFFDEIQNIQGWESFLKKYYDLSENVKFIISGSSAKLLKAEFSTLITGRNLTFEIFPLSFAEFLLFSGVDYQQASAKNRVLLELNNYLEYGGFPEVFFKEKELKKLLLKQYFEDIIYKDVVYRHNINPKKVSDLAVYAMTNISNLFTIRKIRNFTGLSMDSIKDYISYLEDAFLMIPIDHFSYSLKDSSFRPRKSYTIDCGLRNIAGFRFSSDAGRLAENCVRCTLMRRGMEVYYWKGKTEVDFIVKDRDNTLSAYNVCFSDVINKREIESLIEFKKSFTKTSNLTLLTRDVEEKREDVNLIPLWKWLLDDREL